ATANKALAGKREALAAAREQGHELAHQLASARARRDTVARRLVELERLAGELTGDTAREQALARDADRAIALLDEERVTIEGRLGDSEGAAARVAAQLGEAEAQSREAEAALADLLARHAAMRAERRVADAALEAASAQLERATQEHQRLADQLAALGDGSDERQARSDSERSAAAAAKALGEAEARRIEAEQVRAEAADRRDQAESQLAAARAAYSAATAEHDALARALDHGGGAAIASLKAEPGYERALAAALGEDSDAAIGGESSRRWLGSDIAPADPKLPSGTACLADHVQAPPQLQRRLRQVAVAEEDSGQSLSVGQRLVTLAGRMRRWDGFVAEGAGAAAAERLIRANRLAELGGQLPALKSAVEESLAGRDSALAAMDEGRNSAEAARQSALMAEKAARDAVRAGDSAAAALERIDAQRSALNQRLEDLEPVLLASRDAVGGAEQALAQLPDPADLGAEVEQARETASSAAAAVADKRAEAATRARETAADRERLGAG
ncbi:MAG: chromosome segregation protein, partial [Sphingomicrobium sp.]